MRSAVTHRHCLFMTLTAPSRMHVLRMGPNGRQPNPEHDGSTPQDAHIYLKMMWVRLRTRLKRQGMQCWGIRVVEPHFDGTPHWHALMWLEGAPMSLEDVMRICRDSSFGGSICVMEAAAEGLGYLDKYLAKCASPNDQRVSVWASAWGFRLFHRFGIWPEGGAA